MQQASETLDLKQALGVVRRRIPLIALCIVVVAGAAFVFSKSEIKKYTAVASLAFDNNPLSGQIAGLPGSTSGTSVLARQASDLELLKLGDLSAKTASALGHGLTGGQVSDSVSIAGQGESGVVNVSATATPPVLAAEIANTYAREFVEQQKSANQQYFKSALALVRKQLATLSQQQRVGADGLQLQNRAQTLALLSQLQYGNVQVAQQASAPVSPSSPKTSRNTLIGGFLGLFIGLALAFALEPLDRRIMAPKDLEAVYGLPLLGIVPKSSAFDRKKAKALPPVDAEAFNLIRAHLRFFDVDRDLRTVVIASAGAGDGKTTIARYLAEAAARLGSRVLLVEADLRYPMLVPQLDIQPGPGVTDVLIGTVRVDEVAQSVSLKASPDEGPTGWTLDVLPAGAVLPPNPGEMLASHAMEALLGEARSAYDLVVIDTPPLTVVSDAFPLLSKVDGVIIVGRVETSRRDTAERLHQILAKSGAPLLGVIANGSKSGGPSPHRRGRKSSRTVGSVHAASPSSEAFMPAGKV